MTDLMSTAPCGFVSFTDDGTIDEANHTLVDMLDYSRVELLGWHIDKILPPGGRIFYHTYLFPLLKVQALVEEIYIALRTKSGESVPVMLNGRRIERDGRHFNDCVVMRMTQRHAYEDQLLEARRLAEEANAAKSRFLSMMSHDLRTPLTTIDGNAQLLESGVEGPLTPDQRQRIESIRDACRVQTTLINDILDFAQIHSGRVQVRTRPVEVHDAIVRAVSLVRAPAAEAGLRLLTEGGETDVAVLADPDRLQQILLNLLTNAMKFTPPGGDIAVEWHREGDVVRLRVRDSGIGIAEEDLQRIFSPFVQVASDDTVAASTARGVGLGLAICRELARAMDGDVTAESNAGHGSTFTIELPAALAPQLSA